MPFSTTNLRKWLAVAAGVIILTIIGFYISARLQVRQAVRDVPERLGVHVEQTTTGFSLSKSEAGRTLFTIHASNAVQFKEAGRAELRDVTIVLYGRESNRFDQIYGKNFEYDPRSGNIVAKGEVHIDLETNVQGPARPDQMPPEELKNPIHIEASDLTFNQKTGNAVTPSRVRFSMPQASGSAMGVTYDGKTNTLTMISEVALTTNGPKSSLVMATHAVVTKQPRQIVLEQARVIRPDQRLASDQATVFLLNDNTAERILAVGHVVAASRHAPKQSAGRGPRGEAAASAREDLQADETRLQAAQADFDLGPRNVPQSGVMSGGVTMDSAGANAGRGSAQRLLMDFDSSGQLAKLRAVGDVKLGQNPADHNPADRNPGGHNPGGHNSGEQSHTAQTNVAKTAVGRNQARPGVPVPPQVEMASDRIDFKIRSGRIQSADTFGAAQITILSAGVPLSPQNQRAKAVAPITPVRTVVTAGKFRAAFGANNRMTSLHGAPDAKIVSTSRAGAPQRSSTSETLDVAFAPSGTVGKIIQAGNVHYIEGQRQAWAEQATYTPSDGGLILNGSPRVVDQGMTTTAATIRLERQTGNAVASGGVKTTYSELKPQPGGALLATSEPIHATANVMTANRDQGTAVYSGDARLWQGSNIVEGATLTFDQKQRGVVAQRGPTKRVSTVFVQSRNGKGSQSLSNGTSSRESTTPVNITADRLTYLDPQRQARFEGGVVAKSADGVLTADRATVYLVPRESPREHAREQAGEPKSSSSAGLSSSQLERIIAEGHVVLQAPTRRGTGQRLEYTAGDGKFVLTGGPPSIFDAEHGTIRGDSLTFFSRDDRVLVETRTSSPTVTQTRVVK